jgi:hypothetical protein
MHILYRIRYGMAAPAVASSLTVTFASPEPGDPQPVPLPPGISDEPATATQRRVLAIRLAGRSCRLGCSLASLAAVALPLLPLGVGGVRHLQDAMERCRD